MHVLLVGLTPHDAAAAVQMVAKGYSGGRCEVLAAGAALPPADAVVLDIDGCRATSAWQPATGLAALAGRPAVLLAPPLPRDAALARAEDAQAGEWLRQGWVPLRRPFGAAGILCALRRALGQAGSAPARRAASPAALAPTAAAPQPEPPRQAPPPAKPARVAGAGAGTVTSTLSSFPPTSLFGSPAQPAIGAGGALRLPKLGDGSLAPSAFSLAIAHCPLAEARGLLQGLEQQLAAGRPFELVLTLINGLLFDPQAGWAASNTPVSVLRMVSRSRALTGLVRYVPLDARVDPRARAAQRGMPVCPLDQLLYVLARLTDCPLPAAG